LDMTAFLARPGMRAWNRSFPSGDKAVGHRRGGTSQAVRDMPWRGVAHRVVLMDSARLPIICCESVVATGPTGRPPPGAAAACYAE